MELVISLVIMSIVILCSFFAIHISQKRKDEAISQVLSLYEQNCKEHCKTTREVTEEFIKTSQTQVGSVKELHKKTLEILTGEFVDA